MPRTAPEVRAHCIPHFHPVRRTQVFAAEKLLHSGIARRSRPFVFEDIGPPPVLPILPNADGKEAASMSRHLQKIPKPAGEPGHPGSNGYTLREALNWDASLYQEVQKSVRAIAKRHLDKSRAWGKQDGQKQQTAISAVGFHQVLSAFLIITISWFISTSLSMTMRNVGLLEIFSLSTFEIRPGDAPRPSLKSLRLKTRNGRRVFAGLLVIYLVKIVI
jgi:hypothetical protein